MVNGTKIGNWGLRTSCDPSTSPSHSTTTAFTNGKRVCGTKTGFWRFVWCCQVAITPRNVALNLFGYYLVANKLNAPYSNAVGLVMGRTVRGDSWHSNSSCLFSWACLVTRKIHTIMHNIAAMLVIVVIITSKYRLEEEEL